MNDIRARLDGVRREIEKLKAQESLLLDMLDETPAPKQVRAAKGSVKTTVLDLLDEVGRSGLNAATAVDLAKEKGIDLERGSVSSLLSRLKTDGIVTYDGSAYRLKKFTEMPGITPLRTSSDRSF
ncbi:hypothetical protein DC366_15215 [Pelagivirga sediminicola]|uniref:Uncharacterized protein n=1 Tax=Pelagivirga sediminicola TaxID=2170575 RepID=A0A2T7G478_9RHOB|nr:hypothetical protein [Pelagivirga sediminicola]PVA09243.1 hypothetical protein DC366_15215 [Pelagivirga sediminicola]